MEWRTLNDECRVGLDEGRVVLVLYTVDTGVAVEMCCLLTESDELDVVFGVGYGTQGAWDTRWKRGQRAAEMVYAEGVG